MLKSFRQISWSRSWKLPWATSAAMVLLVGKNGLVEVVATGVVPGPKKKFESKPGRKLCGGPKYSQRKPKFNVTFDKAGATPLTIGSNKTLVGLGNSATIRGKGVSVSRGASNVVIRNLTFRDLNAGVVFAGDAITLNDALLIAGRPRIHLEASSSALDTEFWVTLYSQSSNATEWEFVTNGALRTRYRDIGAPSLLEPGQRTPLSFDFDRRVRTLPAGSTR